MATFFKKKLRLVKRRLKNRRVLLLIGVIIACIGAISYATYMQNRRLAVDPTSYGPLLNLIASVESKDNYNAYFGNPKNDKIDFTAMSVADVMKWQKDYVAKGNYSSAVGRYQIINTTLDGLVRRLAIDTSQKFDKTMQDKLAAALLERRGAENYVNKELTKEQFAANLAKEWAALPKTTGDNPADSYYSSDGINRALVSVDAVIKAIEPIKAK